MDGGLVWLSVVASLEADRTGEDARGGRVGNEAVERRLARC
jgi:hypothetical protein